MKAYASKKSGFTLVEILIVVIILGILAAIVIPQFTNASQDARRSSLTSQLQTIRSQIELYKLQHLDQLPSGLTASTTSWDQMISKTDADGTVNTSGNFGPYLQAVPVNPLNSTSNVVVVTTDPTPGTTSASAACGWVLNSANGKFWATDTNGTLVYDEQQ
jgi:general secretion pathway protein G